MRGRLGLGAASVTAAWLVATVVAGPVFGSLLVAAALVTWMGLYTTVGLGVASGPER